MHILLMIRIMLGIQHTNNTTTPTATSEEEMDDM